MIAGDGRGDGDDVDHKARTNQKLRLRNARYARNDAYYGNAHNGDERRNGYGQFNRVHVSIPTSK